MTLRHRVWEACKGAGSTVDLLVQGATWSCGAKAWHPGLLCLKSQNAHQAVAEATTSFYKLQRAPEVQQARACLAPLPVQRLSSHLAPIVYRKHQHVVRGAH